MRRGSTSSCTTCSAGCGSRHLKAAADGLLTANLGNLLRGTFGAALHQINASVYDRAPTAYQYLFETRRPPDADVLRSNVEVPRPFVLRPQRRGAPFAGASCSSSSWC